jgi:hypothetical protein
VTASGIAPDFLAGESGRVSGLRAVAAAAVRDAFHDAWRAATRTPRRLMRAAVDSPPVRRILVLGTMRPDRGATMEPTLAELRRSRHAVEVALEVGGGRGKFGDLNAMLATRDLGRYDWVLAVDDDVELPRAFLDCFVFLAERFALRMAQPAHRFRSHAAWRVTRRRLGSAVRETRFIEIGPVTALHRDTFGALLPFPAVEMGWGLDAHWAAIARAHGWRVGVVDALPIRHLIPIAVEYPSQRAVAEAEAFLATRPYVRRDEAQRTLVTHRSW